MKKLKNKDYYYILLFLLSILLLIPILNSRYFEGHDTGYHMAYILGMNNSLNTKIFPVIAYNFGYGAGLFYPQLAHVLAAFIKLLSSSIFTTLKITDLVIIFSSGLSMYYFMKTVTKNKPLSLVAAIFYLTAPYKIYDMMVRDALNESLIFIFLPIVLLSIYYLFNKDYPKFYFTFVLGYTGLIESHLVLTMYITLFLGVILLINYKKVFNPKTLKTLALGTIIVLLVNMFFLLPLLEHRILGNYVVFSKNAMANPDGVYENALSLKDFLMGDAFVNIIALLFLLYLIVKLKPKNILLKMQQDYLFAVGMVWTLLGMFMSSKLFPWKLMPDFLLLIQFPSRLAILTTLGLSILAYYALQELKRPKLGIVISVVSCLVVAFISLTHQEYKEVALENYNLAETGMGYMNEYLPVKAKENIDYLRSRDDLVHVVKGKADVTIFTNDMESLVFKVDTKNPVTLELPRLYYLGYRVSATTLNETTKLAYQEDEKGFIKIEVPASVTITVDYTGTMIDQISNIISLVTSMTFIGYLVRKLEKNNH